MADFRTHAAFGVGLGIVSATVAASFGLVSGPTILVPIFLAAAIGAVAPDIDSDSGVPFHVAFGALSIVSGGFILSSRLAVGAPWAEAAGFGVGASLVVWFVAGGMFKQLTIHRGMAHSLPAAFLSGLVVFFAAGKLSFGEVDGFLLGTSAMAGYLVHLVLDEVYAAVDFEGKRFFPSRALGTSLKLSSASRVATVATYLCIGVLLYGNIPHLLSLAEGIVERIPPQESVR